ncbi:MAG TPA: hypothetical protein PLE74_07535 [Candidatus Cloacimonadota bacterium]|nr:hypothetical protein [Candidatus Cloacimonadota bacterium]
MSSKIEGLIAAALDAHDAVRHVSITCAKAQRDLVKEQDKLVAAKEAARQADESLRLARQSDVSEEVTHRHVEIARMRGIHLQVGEPLTPVVKTLIFPQASFTFN